MDKGLLKHVLIKSLFNILADFHSLDETEVRIYKPLSVVSQKSVKQCIAVLVIQKIQNRCKLCFRSFARVKVIVKILIAGLIAET